MLTALYSFGPGLCLKTLCPRGAFSLTGYLATAFLLEVEPWLRHAVPAEPVFWWSRTLPGAIAAALLVALGGGVFLESVRRTAWRIIRPYARTGDLSGLKQSALIGGALAGALVSLSFATLSGAAATPLWPLYDGVLLSDPFSSWRLQRLSARFLPLALLIWGFKSMGGRQ